MANWVLQPSYCRSRELTGARAATPRARFTSGLSGRTAESPIYLTLAANLLLNWATEAELMEERRRQPRTEINEPAYVSSGGFVMGCMVRNISAEGAAIDVENPAFVPQRFRLVMASDSASDSSVRECRVAWIQKNRIGLTFVDAP
jgi:hypothetical protein